MGNGINGGLQLLNGSTVNWNGGSVTSNSLGAAGGLLNWSGGTLTAPLSVAANGVVNLTGSGSKYLQVTC